MTARKRTSSESFSTYRENLKAEAAAMKQRLTGRYVWVSKHVNPLLRTVSGKGTYRKES